MSLYFVQNMAKKDLEIPVDLDNVFAHLLLFVSRFPGRFGSFVLSFVNISIIS